MSTSKITRREFIVRAGAVAAAALPLVGKELGADSPSRPNFVFILTDDQRFDAMSCAGHPFLKTPNIDRIAREGALFKNAFVTISLCSPSRACFLTGRYAHSHGIKDNRTPMSDDVTTWPRLLQKAGYDTAFIGKWHMDSQEGPRPGFNRWVSFKGQGSYTDPVINVDGVTSKHTGYMTDILTDYAVSWLKKPRKEPFCLYLCHKAVHGPFTPADRHAHIFDHIKPQWPVSSQEDLTGKPDWFVKRQQMRRGKQTDEEFAEFVRRYYATVVGIDESVGKVLAALDELGVTDNTVIAFAGDNGFFIGEHGMLDKRAAYEESIRIPFVMRYPKLIKPGTTIEQMVLNIDLCPTMLDIAGVQIPGDVHGRSLRPVLTGGAKDWREDFLYEYFYEPAFVTPTIRAVRTQRWKYVEYPDSEYPSELWDLKNDPHEMTNLIGDPSKADVISDMKKRLERLLRETS
ncbi:MAG: sulfatase [Armatimonadota bacterium]|nr:sulfatase [Armatimonadota bacterium]